MFKALKLLTAVMLLGFAVQAQRVMEYVPFLEAAGIDSYVLLNFFDYDFPLSKGVY